MKLTAVTITSDTKEEIIGAALRSVVAWVDEVLIIHLPGLGSDRTLGIARGICGAKIRIVDVPYTLPWAEIRTQALREAEGDWAVVVDTDERIWPGGMNVRAALASVPKDVSVLTVSSADDTYDKERFYRLPFKGEFYGNIHEQLRGAGKVARLEGVYFTEVPKVRNVERFLEGLTAQIASDPTCDRWKYQRAATLEELGRFEEALSAYAMADQTGWVQFCIARCLSNLKRPEEAFRVCHEAMIEHPGYAEFPWLMGWQCLAMGKPFHALAWATMAASLSDQLKFRTGVREPLAYKQGPAQVIKEAKRIIREAM